MATRLTACDGCGQLTFVPETLTAYTGILSLGATEWLCAPCLAYYRSLDDPADGRPLTLELPPAA